VLGGSGAAIASAAISTPPPAARSSSRAPRPGGHQNSFEWRAFGGGTVVGRPETTRESVISSDRPTPRQHPCPGNALRRKRERARAQGVARRRSGGDWDQGRSTFRTARARGTRMVGRTQRRCMRMRWGTITPIRERSSSPRRIAPEPPQNIPPVRCRRPRRAVAHQAVNGQGSGTAIASLLRPTRCNGADGHGPGVALRQGGVCSSGFGRPNQGRRATP